MVFFGLNREKQSCLLKYIFGVSEKMYGAYTLKFLL